MSRVVEPVEIVNIPPPAVDPFTALINKHFLLGNIWVEPYSFNLTWLPLTALQQSAPRSFSLDPDIDFLLQEIGLVAYTVSGGATTQIPLDALINIVETTTRGNLFDSPAHVSLVTGQNVMFSDPVPSCVPGAMPFPRYLRGSNKVTVQLTDRTSASSYVYVSLKGLRVSYKKQATRADVFHVPY